MGKKVFSHGWAKLWMSIAPNGVRPPRSRRCHKEGIGSVGWPATYPEYGTLILVAVMLFTIPSLAAPRGGIDAMSTSVISYQGRLADNVGNPLNDYYNMEFRIYETPEGGTPLWEEYWDWWRLGCGVRRPVQRVAGQHQHRPSDRHPGAQRALTWASPWAPTARCGLGCNWAACPFRCRP